MCEKTKQRRRESQGDVKYTIEWTTLAEYLNYLEKRGISQNVASFIGAPAIREYVIGLDDRPPTPAQLDQMRELVRREMEAGAANLGLNHRGLLRTGMFADVVIFVPQTIGDRATFENPHQYSVGVRDVFVNGVEVLRNGEHTGAKPGRALWGPGKIGGN